MTKPTFTTAIYTRFGGMPLVRAVESIRANPEAVSTPFIIVSDTQPLAPEVRERLIQLNVELYEYQGTRTQFEKIREIIGLCKTEVVILTQDDVYFAPNAVGKLVDAFIDPAVTMVSNRIEPKLTGRFFESIIVVGNMVARYIAENWNNGSNYLLASGRCMAFRVNAIKNMDMPANIISTDAYLYFANKLRGGKFIYCRDVIVYINLAQKLSDYRKQSTRFLKSIDELSQFFDKEFLKKEFWIPISLFIRGSLYAFIRKPGLFILYALLQLYVRFHKDLKALTTLWEADITTKI